MTRRNDRLVRLAGFSSSTEAHILKATLLANGIEACVNNEESNIVMGSLFGASLTTPVEVFVFADKLAEAQLFLSEIPEAAKVNYPNWNCPCGESVDEGFGVCWNCGRAYEDVFGENR